MSDEKKEVSIIGPKSGRTRDLQSYTSPFEDMERLFDDFLHRRFFAPSWVPRLKFPELTDVSTSIDMFEEGGELIIKAEMPGLKKDEISIDFSGDVITISGEKKAEEKTERKDFYRVERSFGSFNRKIRLPVEIQVDKAQASYTDGLLEIRMPKSETEKEKVRKIEVT
ncbi:MAG: Hsp20/alpha crystallin family protein [Desulfuromonadales bacterium]|nr:Hsp20/alpha crystallin family protein [Desulfuromonadales bacterium]